MTKQSIYLHRDDLQSIIQFMDAFGGVYTVEVVCEGNEIGNVITAVLHGVEVNGQKVAVMKTVVDETSW